MSSRDGKLYIIMPIERPKKSAKVLDVIIFVG